MRDDKKPALSLVKAVKKDEPVLTVNDVLCEIFTEGFLKENKRVVDRAFKSTWHDGEYLYKLVLTVELDKEPINYLNKKV